MGSEQLYKFLLNILLDHNRLEEDQFFLSMVYTNSWLEQPAEKYKKTIIKT